MEEIVYLPEQIFTGDEWLKNHALIIENEIIKAVVPSSRLNSSHNIKNLPGAILAPAFIDVQIYGAHQKLFAVYPGVEALSALYDYCKEGGATLFQPTVATNSMDVFYKCIDAVRTYWQQGGKGVHGLHLEGPWINKDKKGAHIEAFIHSPTLEEVKEVVQYGKGVITMITLAPEVCSKEVIEYILSQNIIVSAGHSNATYEETIQAFDAGIPVATHLYNAMSALQHRAPGLVGACLNHSTVKSSLVPDGYHVDFAAIKIAKKVMGDRLFVITDAVTQTNEGHYQHQLEGEKYMSNDILSGSALTMHKCFYNLVNKVQVETGEALRMCSLYPAQVLKCDNQYGKLAPGYKAEAVVLNKQLALMEVISV